MKDKIQNVTADNPRELPGFKKKSFAMFFENSEIWFEHLDGIYENSNFVLEKFYEDFETFARSSMPSLICFNLDETEINDEIISVISGKLLNSEKTFLRVCFVGVNMKNSKKLKKALENRQFVLGFNNDFEKAKKWLVGKL